MLTLSRTAPGSIPNLSAIGIIRSGRLQVFVVKENKLSDSSWKYLEDNTPILVSFSNKRNYNI